jgi:arylsulfatase A-like enzyme
MSRDSTPNRRASRPPGLSRLAGGAIHFALALTGLIPTAYTETVSGEKRVNLIAIVLDDHARWAVGAYGNTDILTPNMDRLAREGALFLNAFVTTPVCSPSRATYLSGLYSTEHSINDGLDRALDYTRIGFRSPTWTSVLRDHGYRIALFGKWHLGAYPEFDPGRFGIGHFFGWAEDRPENLDPVFMVDPKVPGLPVTRSEHDGGVPRRFSGALVDVLTDRAIEFIEAAARREQPFAVMLHQLAPHKPYLPVLQEDWAPYQDLEPVRPPDVPAYVSREWFVRETRAYYASVTSADRALGRLLLYLDESGLAQNTLLVVTSDNGYSLGRHGIETKGNGRLVAAGNPRPPRIPNLYDNSMRIPLIMRWPGVIAPGTVVEQFASNLDFYRTYLGALGVKISADFRGHGVDLTQVFRDGSFPLRDAVFGQYDLDQDSLRYLRMVRTGRWKLVRHVRSYFADQLYDLKNDPCELDNLISRGVVRSGTISEFEFKDLNQRLVSWMRSINDPLADEAMVGAARWTGVASVGESRTPDKGSQ